MSENFIQSAEELVRGWDKLYPFTPPTGLIVLANRIRERDEARDAARSGTTSTGPVPPSGRGASTGKGAEVCSPTSADVGIAKGNPATAAPDSLWPELKGAASPPAAPPPDEAVKAAPDPIGDDFVPDGIPDPGGFAEQLFGVEPERQDEETLASWIEFRDSAWRTWARAALRAERERWAVTPGRICSYCGFVTDSHEQMIGHISECMKHPLAKLAEQYEAVLAAERASADARVRAVAEAARGTCLYDHECSFDAWFREHEPDLARALSGAEQAGGGDDHGE